MRISAIAAMSKNRVIGKDNQIPWHLPADMKFFQRTTRGHHVIMGRKNYESIDKPLAQRTNIVITRNPFFISSGCIVVHTLEDALAISYTEQEEEVFIIGGGEIYRLAMDVLDRIYLTTIDLLVEGDVFFPELDMNAWRVTSEEYFAPDQKNAYSFIIQIFDRIVHKPK
ncbi:MAG TPA: dihydrofolate reductase [Saprospiraceae bacterium]|nr:dihydrofolate reductase [Saprospiraceae bacterium]